MSYFDYEFIPCRCSTDSFMFNADSVPKSTGPTLIYNLCYEPLNFVATFYGYFLILLHMTPKKIVVASTPAGSFLFASLDECHYQLPA